MPSIFGNLEVGRKGLVAEQLALQITGNNIANVNTPGYARQRPVFQESLAVDAYGARVGTGVDVQTVESVRDRFLELRMSNVTENAGRDETVSAYLSQVESVFGTNQSGVQDALSGFFNSFSTLAGDAASAPLRYNVLSAAQTLATTFRNAANQLVDIGAQADSDASDTVNQINSLTSQIAGLNQEIVNSEGPGGSANSLRDARSEALNKLSSLVDIHYFETNDGTVSVSTAGGQTLVTAGFAQNLSAQATPPNGYRQVYAGQIDITATLKGGRLGGLLDVRDRLAPGYQSNLDTLAQSVATQVNAVHQGGTDLQVPPTAPAVDFFTPLTVAAGAARNFSVSAAVAGDIRNIAAGQSGAPGDNANALAIADLANQKLLAAGTQTFADNFAALQSGIGVDAQNANFRRDTNSALLKQLQNNRDAISGVSLDEEAVDLIRFQRAYEASAKFISVIDQITSDLIDQLGS